MKIIQIVTADDGSISPAEPFPSTATSIVCDGTQYIAYEGDEPKEIT
jgi:hypothetical protein